MLLNRGAPQRGDRLGVQLRPHHSRAILAERLAELTYARQGVKALKVKALSVKPTSQHAEFRARDSGDCLLEHPSADHEDDGREGVDGLGEGRQAPDSVLAEECLLDVGGSEVHAARERVDEELQGQLDALGDRLDVFRDPLICGADTWFFAEIGYRGCDRYIRFPVQRALFALRLPGSVTSLLNCTK